MTTGSSEKQTTHTSQPPLETSKHQDITPSQFLERLFELLPVLKPQRVSLRRLSTRTIEDALHSYHIAVNWRWDSISSLSALLERWDVLEDGYFLFFTPSTHSVMSANMQTLQSIERDPSRFFDGQDLLVLGRDSRCLGLFDAQYKHAFVRLPRLFPDPLHFYSVTDDYGQFSNFAPYPIRLQHKIWPTTEHYFQAQKFAGTQHEESIRCAKTPMEAARMGRQRDRPLRPDWESVKLDVMRQALRAKFTQHEDLRALLMATAPNTLVEHTTHDAFWGDGGHGKGQNWLGRLLMELRGEMLDRASQDDQRHG